MTKKTTKLSIEVKRKCIDILDKLPDIKYYSNLRRMEILTEMGELDENIGGSSGGRVGQPTESKAMKLLTDPLLVDLNGVEDVFNLLVGKYSQEKEKLFRSLYVAQVNKESLSREFKVSVRTIERWNKDFLISFADEMGYLEESE